VVSDVHFPDIAGEKFSTDFAQHLTSREDRLPVSLVAARKLNSLIVRQVFAIVNIEEVAWHVWGVR
jgi:hypothetical protein